MTNLCCDVLKHLHGKTLVTAESCTGGKFAAALTEIPGISKVFERGLVTYSNQSKMDELGVKAETLEKSRRTVLSV